jgi:hypothetical protein
MGILSLDDYKVDIELNLTKAKLLGSQEAAFLLWTQKYCQCCRVCTPAVHPFIGRFMLEDFHVTYVCKQVLFKYLFMYINDKY